MERGEGTDREGGGGGGWIKLLVFHVKNKD